jgi:hypothetical protein
MGMTPAELAALNSVDRKQAADTLQAELDGKVRSESWRKKLVAQLGIVEAQEFLAPPDPTEPPPAPLRTIADTTKPPVEPSPEPVVSTVPLASELDNKELEMALEVEQAAKLTSDNLDNIAEPLIPDDKPAEPLPELSRSSDITEEELRKILGNDYDDVMGIKPAVDTVPDTVNVNQPVEAGPDTASHQADLGSDVDTPATPNAPIVERRITKEWLKPDLTSAHEVLGLEPDDIAGLSPEDLAKARATLAAKMEGYNGRNTYADRTLADQFRRIDQQLKETPGVVTAPEHITETATDPIRPDTAPETTPDIASPTETPPGTNTDAYTEEAYARGLASASPKALLNEQESLESRAGALNIEILHEEAHKPPESDKDGTLAFEFRMRKLQERVSHLKRQSSLLAAEVNRRANPDHRSGTASPESAPDTSQAADASERPETNAPPEPIDAPPPLETFDRPESDEPHEPTPLELARAKAARTLMKRGQIFGRVGNEEVNQSIVEYQAALAAEQQPKVEQIKQDFAGRDLSQPDVARELQTRLVELALTDRFAEETALREAMKSSGERSAGHRLKEFWRKNSGKRALIGIGLLGAGIATGGLASPVLGAAILGARVAMSSVGSTMMAEGGLQGLIEKKGWTKKFTAEQISRMSRAQLRTRLAAHITRYGEAGQGEFGTHTTRLLKKTWSDDTGNMLLAEYQLDQQKEIENYLRDHVGETPEQIIAGVLDNSLDEQSRLHEAFAFDRADNRLRAVFKWVASIGIGVVTGATVAMAGMDRLENARAAKSAAKSGLEHAGQSSNAADVSHGAGATGKAGLAASETGHNAGATGSGMSADTGLHAPAGVETSTGAAVEAGGHAAPAAETGAGASVEAGRQAAERAASFKEVTHKGDSVWKMATDQLHRRLGDNFDKLDAARKAYIIDSIKDRVVANPQEFGLDNVDQLAVGKEIDFTAAFEGPHAVNLPEVVSHAKELSQQAVDSITHNNEVIGQWISNHPGEPINDTIIDHLIHGANITAPDTANPTAELLGASHDQLAAALADHMTQNAIQKSILDLANTNPELYARFHEVNPDCYPAVAGVIVETAAPVVESSAGSIELSSSNLNALSKGLDILEKLPQTGTTREVLHSLGEMKVTDAAKAGALSAPLEKAGLDFRSARDVGQSMRKVFMEIVERVGSDTKVRNVLETINKKIA